MHTAADNAPAAAASSSAAMTHSFDTDSAPRPPQSTDRKSAQQQSTDTRTTSAAPITSDAQVDKRTVANSSAQKTQLATLDQFAALEARFQSQADLMLQFQQDFFGINQDWSLLQQNLSAESAARKAADESLAATLVRLEATDVRLEASFREIEAQHNNLEFERSVRNRDHRSVLDLQLKRRQIHKSTQRAASDVNALHGHSVTLHHHKVIGE